MTARKHFLDTSVARPLLVSSKAYKEYFAAQLDGERCYISPYVQMEFRRSLLSNAIDFYFVLDLPNIDTIGDALAFWSNKFKGSQHKAIEQLMAQVLTTRRLDFSRPSNKSKALRAVGQTIKRLEVTFRSKFKDPSNDTTQCGRAAVPFKILPDSMSVDFQRFKDGFNDTKTCRSKCKIDDMLLLRHRDAVEGYIKQAETLPENSENNGFLKVAINLKEVLEKGSTACTCNRCERYGDAVIALNAPRNMTLEHTDRSFNALCPPLPQPHRLHPSETEIHKRTSTDLKLKD